MMMTALASVGCASSATTLKPGSLPNDQGALFGHVEIVNQGEDVTDKCHVVLTDRAERRKANLSLDKTGWVFTAVTPGRTFLSDVACSLGGFIKYSATFHTRTIGFDVPGKGKIAYFGHVFLDLHSEGGGVAPALLFGALGSALANAGEGEDGQIDVRDHFEPAIREYQHRYGQPSSLVPVSSLSTRPRVAPALATGHPPDDAVGFVLGEATSLAEARCTAAKREWKKLDSGQFECSGAAVDQGVPLTITLSECDGSVCELAADAAADGAAWKVLVSRFGLLSAALVKHYGSQFERKTYELEGCADGLQRCFATGRGHTGVTWRWANRQFVSLDLDGGSDGNPTLRLHYATSEPAPPTRSAPGVATEATAP